MEIRRYDNMYFSYLSMNHLIHGQFPMREQKFIESFYEQKNADLDLLFEEMRYNPELKEHPMIEWRLKKM